MKSSWAESFAQRLLAESLFYIGEWGVSGQVSLIDESAAKELYIASYLQEYSSFIIERATAWESSEQSSDDQYADATDSKTHGLYDSAEEAASVLLNLARRHALVPNFALLFEDTEDG